MSLSGINTRVPQTYGLNAFPMTATTGNITSNLTPDQISPYGNPMSAFTTATGGLPTGSNDMMGMLPQIMSLLTSLLSMLMGGSGKANQPSIPPASDSSESSAPRNYNAGSAGNAGKSDDTSARKDSSSPTGDDSNTPAPASGDGIVSNSSLSGANTIPSRLSSASDAANLVDKVKQAGGGTVRIQMSHDEINNAGDMEKLKAMVNEGDKQGVKIQFTFRENANGGGGNILSGDKLTQAMQDQSKVIKQLGNHQSFILDTINESGQHTNEAWFNQQSALIKNALKAGLAGNKIMVEDSEWGGGKANGSGDSGLATYGKQLLEIDPDLMASFHVYNRGDAGKVAADVKDEIESLKKAGFNQKGQINIGEAGNANWKGGNDFEKLPGVTEGLTSIKGYLAENGIVVLPWMDQFVNGQINHTVGLGSDGQIM